MAFPSRWKEILTKHMAEVPKGSPFAAFKAATKAASAEYHGTSSNPDTSQIFKVAGAAAVVYLLVRAVRSGQLSTAGIQEQMGGDTGL